MGTQVTQGAMITCSFGVAPSSLSVIPQGKPVQAGGAGAATIQDFKPMANVAAFGMCQSPSNPQVIAATSAAMGVLTPQPCIPVTTAPWMPGSATVMINGQPALTDSCTLMCQWAGSISFTSAGSALTVSTA